MLHPQLQQFLTLLILFVAGKISAYIHLGWWEAITLVLFAGITEHFLIYRKNHTIPYWSYSAFSTALGVMLMLVASHDWIYAVVIALALLQKHFLVYAKRHFFNPSNFALIVGMLLFYDQAHIVLGQMGEASWLGGLVLVLAGLILVRVGRWRIPLAFVLSYLAFEYGAIVGYDPIMTFEDIWERLYSISFIVFIVFMLTDPRTTPSNGCLQIGFGVLVALGGALLDRWFGFRAQHLFMVLFVVSPWGVFFDGDREERRTMLLWVVILSLMALGAIMWIESRPPFYYEMNR